MNIDEEYADKKKKKEAELCQQLITQCEDKQSIYQKGMLALSLNAPTRRLSLVIGLELQKRQSAPQNADILPTLSINDIEKKVIRTPIIQGHSGSLSIADKALLNDCFSLS